MRLFQKLLKWVNIDFLCLSLLLLISQARLFSPQYVPAHDTMVTFNTFYYFYNEFFFHQDFPRWFPYLAKGVPAYYFQITFLTPLSYIFIVLGSLLRMTDVLFVFKLSILAEHMVFLLGMYLLSQRIYQSRLATLIVCASAILSTFWIYNVLWNFRVYYLMPLLLFFIVLFFNQRKAYYFWISAIVFLLMFMGNLQYMAGFWLWLFVIFGLIMVIKNLAALKSLIKYNLANGLSLTLFLLVFAGMAFFILHVKDYIDLSASGRDLSGGVSLTTFLTYGGIPDLREIVSSLFLAVPFSLRSGALPGFQFDNTVYLGMLPAIFFIWTVFFVRNRIAVAFFACTVFMILFASGGFVSSLLYYFPLMKYFRHIGFVYGCIKIFILICAGFGFDNFFLCERKMKIRRMIIVGLVASGMLFFSGSFAQVFSTASAAEGVASPVFRIGIHVILGILVVWYLIQAVNAKGRTQESPAYRNALLFLMVGVFLLDMFSFQSLAYSKAVKWEQKSFGKDSVFHVSEVKFQDKRTNQILYKRQEEAMALSKLYGMGAMYNEYYNFLLLDPCRMDFIRNDWNTKGLAQLSRNAALVLTFGGGCEIPKIQWKDKLLVFGSDELYENYFISLDTNMRTRIGNNRRLMRRLLITLYEQYANTLTMSDEGQKVPFKEIILPSGALNSAEVKHFTANTLELESEVNSWEGGWLFYADAYHPGWKVTVDGIRSTITRANLAFKAVFLEQGTHQVRFVFDGGIDQWRSKFLAGWGVLVGLFFCFMIILCLTNKIEDNGRAPI